MAMAITKMLCGHLVHKIYFALGALLSAHFDKDIFINTKFMLKKA
jgi:hypothetical protein